MVWVLRPAGRDVRASRLAVYPTGRLRAAYTIAPVASPDDVVRGHAAACRLPRARALQCHPCHGADALEVRRLSLRVAVVAPSGATVDLLAPGTCRGHHPHSSTSTATTMMTIVMVQWRRQ